MQNFSNLLNQIENKRVCRFQSDICCNATYSTVDSTTDNYKSNNDHNLHQIHDNNQLNNAYANSNNNNSTIQNGNDFVVETLILFSFCNFPQDPIALVMSVRNAFGLHTCNLQIELFSFSFWQQVVSAGRMKSILI